MSVAIDRSIDVRLIMQLPGYFTGSVPSIYPMDRPFDLFGYYTKISLVVLPLDAQAKDIIIQTNFSKYMSRKSSRSSAGHSLTVRCKVTLNRVLEVTDNSVKIEINDEGTITGRYNGTQISTIDNSVNQDGTSSWNGKFMQMTNKGDMIVATGSGTGEPANSKGIVKIRGEGKMWTQSTRLANLNGAKWTSEGESNIRTGRSVIYVDINE